MEGKKYDKKQFSTHRKDKKGRLDDTVLQYYRRVSAELDQEFEDDEHANTFFKNVFNQLCTEAIKVSQNHTVSGIVEALLKKATAEYLVHFFHALRLDWETACTDRFASHVTQTLLLCTHKILANDCTKADAHREDLNELMYEPFLLLRSNLGLYIQDTYASHILRIYIEILGCVRVCDSVVKSRLKADYKKENGESEEFIKENAKFDEASFKHVGKMTLDVIAFPKLRSFLLNSVSNPVIQTLMLVLHKRNATLCDRLCSTVIEHCFGAQDSGGIATDPGGSHVVEQLFAVCSDDLFDTLFKTHIKHQLNEWVIHPVANFVVQKLLVNFRSKKQFEKAYKRITPTLEEILSKNCAGVIVSLAKGTLKYSTKQQNFLECLMQAFHCYEPNERQSKLVQLLACMTTYDVFYKVPDVDDDASNSTDDEDSNDLALPTLKSVSLHGSVLIQTLLEFGNPRLVISSFLDLTRGELKFLACDERGSRIFDAFLKSSSVGEKSREHLLTKLKGVYVDLACSKFGSRVMDRIWEKATIKQKSSIAEDLSSKKAKMLGDRFGSFIWLKFGIANFKSRRKEWEQFQSGVNRKRKMFADIISAERSPNKKNKINKEDDSMDDSKVVHEENAVESEPVRISGRVQTETSNKNNLKMNKDSRKAKRIPETYPREKQHKGKTFAKDPNKKSLSVQKPQQNSKPKTTNKKRKRLSLKRRLRIREKELEGTSSQENSFKAKG